MILELLIIACNTLLPRRC